MDRNKIRILLLGLSTYFALVLIYGYIDYLFISKINDIAVFNRAFVRIAVVHIPLFVVYFWKEFSKEVDSSGHSS